MSFIYLLLFGIQILLIVGKWEIRKKKSYVLMIEEKFPVMDKLVFSIWLANFSPTDDKCVLNVLAINKVSSSWWS